MVNDKDGDDSSEEMFDPTSAVDAGEGEELQEASKKAKVTELRITENRAIRENYLEDVRSEPNIIERAKRLLANNLVNFPDTKKTAEGFIALNSDKNRIAAFDLLFGSGDSRPHIDTFCGRLVDWQGQIVDDRYSMVPLLNALDKMGLRFQSMDTIRRTFRDWGMQVQSNDLIKKFSATVPEWDGIERLDRKLIDLFACFDAPLNRSFGKYFWLSLYCRITKPGCLAPMVLSLFGAQDVGKSYFSKLICRTLMQDPDAAPVQLDMGADKINFLRSITGAAIIANIGEMTGFNRTDLNDMKQFITQTSDDMHQKFEGHFRQLRQWIEVMDGNTYVGLQRDDTGNRRFYPMFVGQLPDKHGQPAWSETFKADFTGFENDLWQIMAECRNWLSVNGGMDGYNAYVNSVSGSVKEFSNQELMRGRGAVADAPLDTFLVPALLSLNKLNAEIVAGRKNRGVWITTAAISARIKYLSKGSANVMENHLKVKMMAMGASPELIGNIRGYIFREVMNEADYLRKIRGDEDDEEVLPAVKFHDDGDF